MATTPNTKFYFIRQDNGEAYEMSATTNITITKDMIATERAVESGKSITDNSYLENAQVSFSGLITNIRNASTLLNVDQFINEINELRAEDPRVLVDVYADGQFVENCLIVSFNINKTASEGLGAWKTDFRLQEIEFSERAALVLVPEASVDTKDRVDKMTSKSSNTTQELKPLEDVTRTSLVATGGVLMDIVDGNPTITTPVNSGGGNGG